MLNLFQTSPVTLSFSNHVTLSLSKGCSQAHHDEPKPGDPK